MTLFTVAEQKRVSRQARELLNATLMIILELMMVLIGGGSHIGRFVQNCENFEATLALGMTF